jgi:hypothetical protein
MHPQFLKDFKETPRPGKEQCNLCGGFVKSMKDHRMLQHRMGPVSHQCMVSVNIKRHRGETSKNSNFL